MSFNMSYNYVSINNINFQFIFFTYLYNINLFFHFLKNKSNFNVTYSLIEKYISLKMQRSNIIITRIIFLSFI